MRSARARLVILFDVFDQRFLEILLCSGMATSPLAGPIC